MSLLKVGEQKFSSRNAQQSLSFPHEILAFDWQIETDVSDTVRQDPNGPASTACLLAFLFINMQFTGQSNGAQTSKSLGDELWSFRAQVIIFEDNTLIGDFEKLIEWSQTNYHYNDYRPLPLWHAMAKEKYKTHLLETKHDFVYFDIQVSSEHVGRLLIELYSEKCPKTCINFLELCRGGKMNYEKHDPPLELAYNKSIFHRIVPNGWIQGGDFVTQKGTGGQSIYGSLFEDENFSVLHNKRGVVGMANKGRHTNSSQFYITLQPTPWMDKKYVAFGQVIEGMKTLKILEDQETYNERPKKLCLIADCGIFDVAKLWT